MERTSRQKLLEFLGSRPAATTAEISRVLKTTPANVRHHLSMLIEEGVVQIAGERRTAKRGRPMQLYTLTSPFTRHNLDNLSSALLDILQEDRTLELMDAVVEQIAQRLTAPRLEARQPTQRLNEAIQRLNQMGYLARWEAHASGPRLILGHCPYYSILSKYPLLCQVDTRVISLLSGRNASLEARLEPGSSGLPQCVFRAGSFK